MATALDLLMSAKEDTNLLSEESDICTIDAKTRSIFVPSTIVVGGVQSDKNAERIKFSCPKIVGDNLDLSKFSVRINFENVSSVDSNVSIKDQYICDDVAVDGENVTFSWLIGRNAARYMGTVRFIVCAVKTDSDSNISVEWNTAIAEVPVLEGIEIDQPQIGQEEKDVINQLLELTKNTSAEAVQNVNSTKEQAIKDIQSVSQPDTTLTIEGGLAEAKATGEAIGSLKEDLTQFKNEVDYLISTDNPPLYAPYLDLDIRDGYVSRDNGQMATSDTDNKTVFQQKLDTSKTHITFIGLRCLAFYDENKTYISGTAEEPKKTEIVEIPTNARFISYSWKVINEPFFAYYGQDEQIYNINVPTTLEKRVKELERGRVISVEDVDFLKIGVNLFNKATESQDVFLSDAGEVGQFDGYCVSDFIRVKANTSYISNKNIIKYCLYDIDKNYLSTGSSNGVIITPSYEGFIRIAYYSPTSDKHTSDELMFVENDTVPSNYIAYCYYLNSTEDKPIDLTPTWWKDKLICTYGDSNVANERWQKYMNEKLGCKHQNCGIGGTSMCGDSANAMWQDSRIATINENTNAILIMAGTNDSASTREIGTMSTDNTDTNTFVGAYNTCVRKIYEKMGTTFPIFLFTPIPCFDTTTYHSVKEISQAVREIGAMWSLPVIDAQNECGINVVNWTSLYAEDGVHVDYKGGKMLASLVVGILKSHEPIESTN